MKAKMTILSFISGLIFGVGLIIGGMTRPDRVLGFLNFFGEWDPTLIFVMGGAVAVHMILFPLITSRSQPIFPDSWDIPQKEKITKSLIIGSFIFGIGWGLGGYCPGPGITALASFHMKPLIFVISMVVGMAFYKATQKN